MQLIFGLAVAALLKATAAVVSNGTTETVFITQTAWSTVFSCPAPQTVTVCDAECTAPSVNNANIVYQTISDGQAGQIYTIDGTQTTLPQATAWTIESTISGLVLNPAGFTVNEYTASATLTDFVYPSSVTATSGEVVTCQTGVTTINEDGVILTDCPCTVQSTVLELTATAAGAVPTAVIPSNYIVKIIYVYEIEVIVEQVPTTITTTATETLTTTQTTTQTEAVTTTDNPRPTIVTVDRVTFMLQYDTAYDGVPVGGLRKRQAIDSPLISIALNACLVQCAGQADCRAASFVEATTLCTPLIQFDALSPRNSLGEIFAIVILRPSTSSSSTSSSNMLVSTTPRISRQSGIVSSTSLRSSPPTSSEDSTTARSSANTGSSSSSLGSSSSSSLAFSSSSKTSSSSAFYPMSNTSVSSMSLSLRSSSSSIVSLSITGPSNTPVTSSSSEASSSSVSTTSNLTSSTTSSLTNSSISSPVPTSTSSASSNAISSIAKSSSVTLPITNASTSSLTSSTPVSALTGCAVASDVLGYLPAMSYCSSAYPVATYTQLFNATMTNVVTVSALNSTMYKNITLPTQTTVKTDKETTIETGVTLVVSTVIQNVTTTTTITSTPMAVATTILARRQAVPSVQAMIFSSILSRPATDIALVCSCLQTPATVSSRSTETVLSTTSVTPVVDATNYFTPPVVTTETTEITTTTLISTILSETTSTATAVATAIVPPYPQCDPSQAYNGAGGRGGCSSGCFCNADVDQVNAYCGSNCGADDCMTCTSDSDCPSGEFCDTFNFGGGSGSCYSVAGCSSSYTPKKKRFVADHVENILTGRSNGPMGDLNRPWLVHN